MGDYLENLAARALGIAPIVRPRPASRFEPPPVELAEPSARGSRPRVPPLEERAALDEVVTPEAASESPPMTTTLVAPPSTPTALQAPPAMLVAEERDERPAGKASPAHAPAPADPRAGGAPDRKASLPRRRLDRPPASLRARARRPATPEPGAWEAPPGEPPTARVTIGRIEVRAVTSSAPKPRPAQQRPAPLSLDEYLEQRRDGRR